MIQPCRLLRSAGPASPGFQAVQGRTRSRLTEVSRRVERRRNRDVVREIGRSRKLHPVCFQRWLEDRQGYPAKLDSLHAQTDGCVLTMLKSIAIRRVVRTGGNGKIEPAEVKRKHGYQQQGNCPCGCQPSCSAFIPQGGYSRLEGVSCPSRVSGFISANAAANLQNSFLSVKQLYPSCR